MISIIFLLLQAKRLLFAVFLIVFSGCLRQWTSSKEMSPLSWRPSWVRRREALWRKEDFFRGFLWKVSVDILQLYAKLGSYAVQFDAPLSSFLISLDLNQSRWLNLQESLPNKRIRDFEPACFSNLRWRLRCSELKFWSEQFRLTRFGYQWRQWWALRELGKDCSI